MKKLLPLLLVVITSYSFAQKPKSGTYFYKTKLAEFRGRLGETVKVIIKKDSIFVYSIANSAGAKKGELFEKGFLRYNTVVKKWIISNKIEDTTTNEVGGCSGGPSIINFRNKWYWRC